MSYKIPDLDATEFQTLCWLNDRGYDGGILDLTAGDENDDGTYTFERIPENVAWRVKENVESDYHAWLACCGSDSLAEKLNHFVNSIV